MCLQIVHQSSKKGVLFPVLFRIWKNFFQCRVCFFDFLFGKGTAQSFSRFDAQGAKIVIIITTLYIFNQFNFLPLDFRNFAAGEMWIKRGRWKRKYCYSHSSYERFFRLLRGSLQVPLFFISFGWTRWKWNDGSSFGCRQQTRVCACKCKRRISFNCLKDRRMEDDTFIYGYSLMCSGLHLNLGLLWVCREK